jgi:hypothetical protein
MCAVLVGLLAAAGPVESIEEIRDRLSEGKGSC